jgi:integrase/recombinase XerC
MRKPWLRKRDGWWYVGEARGGRFVQRKLSQDREEAFRIWRSLRATPAVRGPSISGLASQWARWAERNRRPATVAWYGSILSPFLETYGAETCANLAPYHVTTHCVAVGAGSATERALVTCLKAMLNWGVSQGLIEKNPLAAMKRPPGKKREYLVVDEQRVLLLREANPELRLAIYALWNLGCRPEAIRTVTAANYISAMEAWVFPAGRHKTGSKTGRPLVVYMTPCMDTLTRILARYRPAGPLFLNAKGKPWTKDTINYAFTKLRKRLGLPKELLPYSFRHTFTTNALLKGIGIAAAAELLGHTDTSMVSRHYGHLDQHQKHLRDSLRKVRGEDG